MLRRSTSRILILGAFYALYLVIGASVFCAIEGPDENKRKQELKDIRKTFLEGHTSCITDGELEAFIEKIVEAQNRGVSAIKNVTSESNWSFGQSLFFAGTILTTIGYGHVTPLSEGGKVFCVVYALIGIPLTLILFTAIVERLMLLTNAILSLLEKKLSHILTYLQVRLLHLAIIFTFLLVFIFITPAVIFTCIEKRWNFLDSFYYCFISMTTIGLGDYIPGDDVNQQNRALYKILTTVYLFIGLTIMMLTLATIYEIPELNIGSHFYLKSDAEHETEKQTLRKPTNNYNAAETEQSTFGGAKDNEALTE
ncbi:DgyrCDS10053 [Dimorphilus gyrociliatus]|uniref:DgyrCDS10053 n=1 Tax=Dimorphilus gyrociliatus TaxID=2664684 RepID=A0A7I8W077_9ANNE|nr:DgyrCDS10053 [Dimorphilus gyrociliatus]